MADFVELGAEAVNHVTEKHFDCGYDRYRRWVNGKKTDSVVTPYDGKRDDRPAGDGSMKSSSRRDSRDDERDLARSEARSRGGNIAQQTGPPRDMRSSGAASARAPPDASYTATTSFPPADQTIRRKDRDTVPPSDRDNRARTATAAAAGAATGVAAARYIPPPSTYPSSRRDRSLERQSYTTDNVLTDYERERDDPPCRPEKILSPSQLNRIPKSSSRRDSTMTSRYGDDYREGGSQYAPTRPRSQPPRSRHDDDGDDSDYDERSGRRSRTNGRGYDDRDYDRVVEETERYRGPVRRDDRAYDDDRTYAAGGTVAQYDRNDRRSGDYDRDRDTYVSRRRSRSRRGSDYYDDDRSRDGERGDGKHGWKDKIENNFDTSTQGLGVGLAGAVIGGLAGREFGAKGRHSERDIAIGAIIGGLGANIAEAKWREWKDKKEGKLERDEDRWEQKWDGQGGQSGIGRSRSNVR